MICEYCHGIGVVDNPQRFVRSQAAFVLCPKCTMNEKCPKCGGKVRFVVHGSFDDTRLKCCRCEWSIKV